MQTFLDAFTQAGGEWEEKEGSVRCYIKDTILPVDIKTEPHPGFMTDWQGPWSVLMTQAQGESIIHETIYENRFAYVTEMGKMGAKLEMFTPNVDHPSTVYNFNYDDTKSYQQGLKISGPTPLHNAVLNVNDLRAGATLIVAALLAQGESVVFGTEIVERGYENFHARLQELGADVEELEQE